MPEKDGYKLIKEIRKREKAQNIKRVPAIALTAYARVENRMKALSSGFQMHVPKPAERQIVRLFRVWLTDFNYLLETANVFNKFLFSEFIKTYKMQKISPHRLENRRMANGRNLSCDYTNSAPNSYKKIRTPNLPQAKIGFGISSKKRGCILIENGEHKGKAGDGQFLKRGTCVNV